MSEEFFALDYLAQADDLSWRATAVSKAAT